MVSLSFGRSIAGQEGGQPMVARHCQVCCRLKARRRATLEFYRFIGELGESLFSDAMDRYGDQDESKAAAFASARLVLALQDEKVAILARIARVS
ncbi:MAG: hypothetical protein HY983_04110 [Candidatus Magasanikbacteria bacterium]|nr:hypothetical protein [Candidatus Magasanikbacteria bacterium]